MKKYDVPEGFRFLGKNIGIKEGKKDFAIAISDNICSAAALFTKNSLCGVSIPIGKDNINDGKLQAVVVTSGIANVATGSQGTQNTKRILNALSKQFNINHNDIVPSSTGVIGPQLPIDLIEKSIGEISMDELSSGNIENFVEAIMTTDTKKKIISRKVGDAVILAVCKGSGMIEPNMATMLVYLFTDAIIDSNELHEIILDGANKTLNMMSIDTDTSTSDTLVAMSTNKYSVDKMVFKKEVHNILKDLTMMIAKDGEGASKLIEVNVRGAQTFQQAKIVAKAIVNSPLVKTAVYGKDPNWGRVIMAIGKVADENIHIDNITIGYGDIDIYNCGEVYDKVEDIRKYLYDCEECIINVDLGIGKEHATVWGCDLTEEYVRINGSYTS